MNIIVKDFFQLGSLRILARLIGGFRGLFIAASLFPNVLGEYTIWLLYAFYFSFLEFGILKGLERDLSHYRGLKDEDTYQSIADIGWSSFVWLSLAASLCLATVSFIVFKQWVLAFLLGGYLFTDKLYRAYDTNSRIFFRYKTNGIAELIQGATGLVFILYCLPRYGIYSIFPCFMGSLIIATLYLAPRCPLKFRLTFSVKRIFKYIQSSFSLAIISYEIQIFNVISLTVVAFIWDKTTLGYYAFAFRIFEVCLAAFPFLIQEIMRTRMYYNLAKIGSKKARLNELTFPMSVYGLITSIFWLMVYWWSTFAISQFIPQYKSSIVVLNILIFSLLPLGISKISSDYLCSRIYNKNMIVTSCWGAGIFLQIVGIFLANYIFHDAFNIIPIIYLLSTIMIYLYIAGYAFRIGKEKYERFSPMSYLLSPLAVALASVWLINNIFGSGPSLSISKNVYFSAISIAATFAVSVWLIWPKRLYALAKRVLRVFKKKFKYSAIKLNTGDIKNQTYKKYLGGGESQWESRGVFQLNLLKEMGLLPSNTLLDVGCGPIRAGIYFIDYLNEGNYCGVDYNKDFLEAAKSIVKERLSLKKPRLEYIKDFDCLDGEFDYILAFSVLNHCNKYQRMLFFQNVPRLFKKGTKLFITHGAWFKESMLSKAGMRLTNRINSGDMTIRGWEDNIDMFPILGFTRREKV